MKSKTTIFTLFFLALILCAGDPVAEHISFKTPAFMPKVEEAKKLAFENLRRGLYEAAAKNLQDYLVYVKDQDNLYIQGTIELAKCYLRAGHPNQVLAVVEKCRQERNLNQDQKNVFFLLCMQAKFQQRQWSEVEDLAKKLLKQPVLDKKIQNEALFLLVRTLIEQDGKIEEAAITLENYLKIHEMERTNADFQILQIELFIAKGKKFYKNAIDALKKLKAKQPTIQQEALQLYTYSKTGNLENARKVYGNDSFQKKMDDALSQKEDNPSDKEDKRTYLNYYKALLAFGDLYYQEAKKATENSKKREFYANALNIYEKADNFSVIQKERSRILARKTRVCIEGNYAFAETEKGLENLRQFDPTYEEIPDLLRALAEKYHREGKYQNAADKFRAVRTFQPLLSKEERLEAARNEALCLNRGGNPEKAIAIYNETIVLANTPSEKINLRMEIAALRAQVFKNSPTQENRQATLQEYDIVITEIEKIQDPQEKRELQTKATEAWLQKGKLYLTSKLWKEAIPCFEKILQIAPDHEYFSEALFCIITAKREMADEKNPRELLAICNYLKPLLAKADASPVWMLRIRMEAFHIAAQAKDQKTAEEFIAPLTLPNSPDRAQALFYRAMLRIEQGDDENLQRARSDADSFFKEYSKHDLAPEFNLHLADTYAAAAQYSSARIHYNRARDHYNSARDGKKSIYLQALYGAAHCNYKLENFKDAQEALSQIIKETKRGHEALRAFALYLLADTYAIQASRAIPPTNELLIKTAAYYKQCAEEFAPPQNADPTALSPTQRLALTARGRQGELMAFLARRKNQNGSKENWQEILKYFMPLTQLPSMDPLWLQAQYRIGQCYLAIAEQEQKSGAHLKAFDARRKAIETFTTSLAPFQVPQNHILSRRQKFYLKLIEKELEKAKKAHQAVTFEQERQIQGFQKKFNTLPSPSEKEEKNLIQGIQP